MKASDLGYTKEQVITFFSVQLINKRTAKIQNLAQKVLDKQSKILDKNAKIQDLKSDIRSKNVDIDSYRLEIHQLPPNKAYKGVAKQVKIDNKLDQIADKLVRIEQVKNDIIAIENEIVQLQQESSDQYTICDNSIAILKDNWDTEELAYVFGCYYVVPRGTVLSYINNGSVFTYMDKRIVVSYILNEEDVPGLPIANYIDSNRVDIKGNYEGSFTSGSTSILSNVTIDGGIFIGSITQH
jgi:hypothetical protein